MSVPDPIINFRAPQQIKDAIHIAASRSVPHPMEAGPWVRKVIIERIATDAALAALPKIGLPELLRRLSKPSYPAHTAQPSYIEETNSSANTVKLRLTPSNMDRERRT